MSNGKVMIIHFMVGFTKKTWLYKNELFPTLWSE